ncbi:MAG: hypothetical protein ACI9SE_003256 [Neolewinella sp.]|jgi:hypothetical protein
MLATELDQRITTMRGQPAANYLFTQRGWKAVSTSARSKGCGSESPARVTRVRNPQLSSGRRLPAAPSLQAVSDAPASQVVGGQFGADAVTGGDPDPELTHLATGLADQVVVRAIDTNTVTTCSKCLQDLTFDFDCFFLYRSRRTPTRTSTMATQLIGSEVPGASACEWLGRAGALRTSVTTSVIGAS